MKLLPTLPKENLEKNCYYVTKRYCVFIISNVFLIFRIPLEFLFYL